MNKIQDVFEAQGYIILGTFDSYHIGDKINNLNWSVDSAKGPEYRNDITVMVIGIATREEAIKQAHLFGDKYDPTGFTNYIKVVAE